MNSTKTLQEIVSSSKRCFDVSIPTEIENLLRFQSLHGVCEFDEQQYLQDCVEGGRRRRGRGLELKTTSASEIYFAHNNYTVR